MIYLIIGFVRRRRENVENVIRYTHTPTPTRSHTHAYIYYHFVSIFCFYFFGRYTVIFFSRICRYTGVTRRHVYNLILYFSWASCVMSKLLYLIYLLHIITSLFSQSLREIHDVNDEVNYSL